MRSGAALGAVALLTVVAAGAGILLLAPEVPTPAPVDAAAWFDAASAAEAREYRPGQRRLSLLALSSQLVVLGLLAAGLPRISRRLLERVEQGPLVAAGAAGAGIWLLSLVATLPWGFAGHLRAVEYGRSVQSDLSWLGDRLIALGISGSIAVLLTVSLVLAWRRLPRTWPLLVAALVVAGASLYTLGAPRVVAPLFNEFEPLGPGDIRADVRELAERSDVDVDEIVVVDASRRGTGLNAYVDGLGATRRVVLYDNLVERAPPAELRAIVAHEIAHVEAGDVRRGLTFLAIVALPGMLLVAAGGGLIARRARVPVRSLPALPAYALSLLVVSTALALAGNALSRQVEAAADARALELTGEPAAFACKQVRMVRTNLSEPHPSALERRLWRTHPTPVERVGFAVARGAAEGETVRPGRCPD